MTINANAHAPEFRLPDERYDDRDQTRATDPLAAIPCPSWCTLAPVHPVDSIHPDLGRKSRGHGGPTFGKYLDAGADEYADAPGLLTYVVQLHAEGVNMTKPSELLDLATQAIAAAQWLEAHR